MEEDGQRLEKDSHLEAGERQTGRHRREERQTDRQRDRQRERPNRKRERKLRKTAVGCRNGRTRRDGEGQA
jgi:hypothetical protein